MGTHGALFFEPYDDQPGNYGHYRPHTSDDPKLAVPNMDKMYGLIKTGSTHGFVSNVHAIGDKGSGADARHSTSGCEGPRASTSRASASSTRR
jgi:hypothetical protein